MDTELDKEVIENIADPLKHLVRNCVDHGIESPEERISKGKPAEGVIEFKAYQKEGRILIEIVDDGKGIEWESIYRKAVGEGWTAQNAEVSRSDLMAVLFRPGFSTSSSVPEVSVQGLQRSRMLKSRKLKI